MRQSRLVIALGAIGAAFVPVMAAGGQRPPLVGTVSPGAVGAPAPTPVPIGGLRTQPIPGAGVRGPRGTGVSTVPGRFAPGVIPLAVADAPLLQRGVVIQPDASNGSPGAVSYWTPTAQRPRWTQDSSVVPVQAWRDLIVTDVVCTPAGVCRDRQQRVRARWIAGCACYAFADALNRIWKVE
jgi:hypothetical protein